MDNLLYSVKTVFINGRNVGTLQIKREGLSYIHEENSPMKSFNTDTVENFEAIWKEELYRHFNLFQLFLPLGMLKDDLKLIFEYEEPETQKNIEVEYWVCTIGPFKKTGVKKQDIPFRKAIYKTIEKVYPNSHNSIDVQSGWGCSKKRFELINEIWNLEEEDLERVQTPLSVNS